MRSHSGVIAAAFGALTYLALFRLPFLFPPTRRLVSASYVFGFNNALAILALAGLLGIATLYQLRRRGSELVAPRSPLEEAGSTPRRLPLQLLALGATIYGGLTLALAWYAQHAPSTGLTWESRHFLHRIRLFEVYGLRPYLDFHVE